jgi:hypothetical protein
MQQREVPLEINTRDTIWDEACFAWYSTEIEEGRASNIA